MLALLIGAAPAAALPTGVSVTGPVGSFTTYRTLAVHVELDQPGRGSSDDGLRGAPLTLRAPDGFQITEVVTESTEDDRDGITPVPGYEPSTTWAGTVNLSAGHRLEFNAQLRAPGTPRAAVSPLELTVGGQNEPDLPDQTGAAGEIEIVEPQLTIKAPASAPLFPTEQTGLVTATIKNVSTHRWSTGLKAALAPGRGLALLDIAGGEVPLDWSLPPLESGQSQSLSFRVGILHGAPEGAGAVTVTPTGGAPQAIAVEVAPPPNIEISPVSAPLVAGGGAKQVTLTVTNDASISTKPFTVAVDLPEGLELVSTSPPFTAAGVWAVGALAPEGTAQLKVMIKATSTEPLALGAQVLRYSADRVTQPIPVAAAPPAQVPQSTVTRAPVAPVVIKPPALPPPADVLSIDFTQVELHGVAHTYRGELLYRGGPLRRALCAKAKVSLRVWKVKRGKRSGKIADEVKVTMRPFDGHCLFGVRYAFFKRYKGKPYRLDFLASVNASLGVSGGKSPRPPDRIIVRRSVTVGKTP